MDTDHIQHPTQGWNSVDTPLCREKERLLNELAMETLSYGNFSSSIFGIVLYFQKV